MSNEFSNRMAEDRAQIENYLSGCFCKPLPQKKLFEAMRYSLLAGGKRIRPVLTLEFCRLGGGDPEAALPLACAVEMVHTYSLIHDDLPCMDDDDFRRGKPTNHKVFGEDTAVLAGDALLTAAFSALAHSGAPAPVIVAAVAELADAAGEEGMVGGQILDVDGPRRAKTDETLRLLHSLKTGAMIRAACRIGVQCAGGKPALLDAASAYADALGLAFQIRDDMLDAVGDPGKLGKPVGSDERAKKCTFVTLYGLDGCAEQVRSLTRRAQYAIAAVPGSEFLSALAASLENREK